MSISCGDDHAAFITSKDSFSRILDSSLIYTMGSNHYGQLGVGDSMVRMKNSPVLVEYLMDKKPVSIACGSTHTVVATGNTTHF